MSNIKEYTIRLEKATKEVRTILDCYYANVSPTINVVYCLELEKVSKKYNIKYDMLNKILQCEK